MDYEELCCERLLEWQQGKTPGPLHLTVFPTFRCNLNCTICSRHWYAEPRIKEGCMARYARLVTSGSTGAILEVDR